jgi:ProP effector
MRSNPSSSTLEDLFNELSERAESSFQVLEDHQKKIAELTQAKAMIKEENQRLQEKCNSLNRLLAQTQAELKAIVQYAPDSTEAVGTPGMTDNIATGSVDSLLQAENAQLKSELAAAQASNQGLEQRLNDVQQRLKNLADESSQANSEVILTLLRETLDPADWPKDGKKEDRQEGKNVSASVIENRDGESEEAHDNTALERFDAKEILAQWSKHYPKAFSTVSIQPLKIGIHEDLASIHENLIHKSLTHEGLTIAEPLPDHWIRRALAGYVKSPRYLRVLKAGAVRMDLAGNNAGFVTEEEARHAKEQLEIVRHQRLEKEKAVREKEEKKRLNSKLSQLLNKK